MVPQRACRRADAPPQVAARRLIAENIPLYTFTFGKWGGRERADLSLDDLVTNETIFADAQTEVRAQLTSIGYTNQRAKVQLPKRGREWKWSTRLRSRQAGKVARCPSL